MEQFTIGNDGTEELVYGMTVDYVVNESAAKSGGPDAFGYYWKDSDELDGPDYNWVDISSFGTNLYIGDEEVTNPLNLGFNFDFYGNIYNTVNVCSNGYLIFDSDYDDYNNFPIPNSDFEPNNFIAAFWNDLDPSVRGGVYYFSDSSNKRFIVQFNGVSQYDSLSTNTFQIILYQNGSILLQYKEMNGWLENCSAGVEDITGTIGLEVVYNAQLIKNNYAVLIRPTVKWLTLSPESGIVQPSENDPINATFDSVDLFAGVYKAIITLTTNDPVNAIVTIPVEFDVLAIPAPVLSSPADLSLTTDLTPTFDWGNVNIATSYTILVDNNSNFSSPEINQTPTASTYTPGTNLATGTYYWKVRTNISALSGSYSSVWTFELGSLPSAPTLISPATWSYLTDFTPTLDWSDASGATSYTLLVGNSDFSVIEIDTTVTLSTFTPATNLAAGGHYWKVLANNKFGSSSYSARWYFILGNVPAVPTLSSPADVSSTTDLTPTFDWADVSGATSYTIIVDNNSDFSSPEITQSPTASTYTPGTDLAAATYYWKVLATNNFGSSAYSSAWNVRLYILPAVPANVTTSVVSGNIYINWDDSANATSYDIYSSTTPYGTYSLLTNVSVSEYTYNSVSGNSKMFFKVVAKNTTKVSPAAIEVKGPVSK
ncbi:MAG TPA: hypothetical protein PLK90_05095 [Clostridiales bacterium]|nr:hypothetical protein [Clostridiales bacterium]HQP69759.1 hypothetical protein [Clostridiales bacterium]